tara:strand:- start:465 stop:1433 length:969 start_codon:yes stop_codon:yes gene_type:complete
MSRRDFLKDFIQDVQGGWDVAKEASNINEKVKRQYRHSVFDPRFARDMSKGMEDILQGEKTIKGTRKLNNPAEFLGAYANRIATDVGTDSSRQFLWRYNHPMALAELAGNTVIGKEGMKKIKELTPTERAGIMTASIGMPAFASMGTIDATNPGELFRPKGYAQNYAGVGSDDRRKTEQPGLEAIDRFVLGRRGRPLKYSEAKKDIPNLTPQKYGQFLKNYYQDKGATGLGLFKFTGENLEGHPEARILGFPIGLQGVAAVTGGGLGARSGLRMAGATPRGIALRGGLGALAGMAVGKTTNMIIASANRPKYPSTYEYTQGQ